VKALVTTLSFMISPIMNKQSTIASEPKISTHLSENSINERMTSSNSTQEDDLDDQIIRVNSGEDDDYDV
jgi:hypothetical protein